ncbi:MAG TPA: hypothetical protein VL285_16800 [Bryobacteraceae bacterium]|nr:hypothetical protein [Bryobacteraceae bacterium]
MRRTSRPSLNGACLVCLLASAPPALRAQTPTEMNARFQAMEERIKALESEVSTLKAALAAVPEPAAAPQAPPGPAPPQPMQPTSQTGAPAQSSDASARLMNPAISLIGNLLGAGGHNPVDQRPSLQMVESELALSAAVDPYARADVYLSFGEEGVEVEEAYMTFTSLPAGLLLRGGRMRANFGKVNTLHRHVLPWVDRPLVNSYLLGGEDGIRDAGLSVSRLLPSPGGLFLEAVGQVYRGDSSVIFQQRSRNDLTAVGHLRAYRDLNESTNLDLGFSFARGHHGEAELAGPYTIGEAAAPNVTLLPGDGNFLVSRIYGMDATLRWKPLRRAIYHSFVGRAEMVWHHRQEPFGLRKAFGYYASGEYQLARRWFAGVRVDQSDRLFGPRADDRQQSVLLTYWPSEFSQIRAQFRHGSYAGLGSGNELLFQLQFSIGSHGAHPF